ncbi:hypothetical protein HNQ07_004172 [Deinococcus metalli]|nr:hypothetical protein [Deinococcus metalli]MBB5378665.1 hypothetical protein [Deinococcus metalli]
MFLPDPVVTKLVSWICTSNDVEPGGTDDLVFLAIDPASSIKDTQGFGYLGNGVPVPLALTGNGRLAPFQRFKGPTNRPQSHSAFFRSCLSFCEVSSKIQGAWAIPLGMPSAVIDATALKVILDLPSGTEISEVDLKHAIQARLPEGLASTELAAIREVVTYLASLGYLMVQREEPGLYRVPCHRGSE